MPHHTTPSPSSMSSITTTTHHHIGKHQTPKSALTNTKKAKYSRKVTLHQPMSPSSPDDWVLFPNEIVTEKHASIRHAKSSNSARSANVPQHTLPSPDSHVIERKATTPARTDSQRIPKPYRPSTCLHHMSARNCTAACEDVRAVSETRAPPKAPSPPRLPTPELSDFGEEDLWSCCRSSETNESDNSTQGDDFWNKMGTFRSCFIDCAKSTALT